MRQPQAATSVDEASVGSYNACNSLQGIAPAGFPGVWHPGRCDLAVATRSIPFGDLQRQPTFRYLRSVHLASDRTQPHDFRVFTRSGSAGSWLKVGDRHDAGRSFRYGLDTPSPARVDRSFRPAAVRSVALATGICSPRARPDTGRPSSLVPLPCRVPLHHVPRPVRDPGFPPQCSTPVCTQNARVPRPVPVRSLRRRPARQRRLRLRRTPARSASRVGARRAP